MCAAIQAQLSRPVVKSQPVRQIQPASVSYRTEMKAVTRRVKRCNGRTCWYETITEYVPVRVAISSPAKPEAADPTPVVAPAKLDLETVIELAPTPQPIVEAMLRELQLTPADKFFDLGCGDGRFLVTAAKYYGSQSFGVELNPDSAKLARANAAADFVTPLVTIFEGDVRDYDLTPADAVTLYLYPELMEKVVPMLRPGTRVASYLHPIPGVEASERRIGDEVFYVGVVR